MDSTCIYLSGNSEALNEWGFAYLQVYLIMSGAPFAPLRSQYISETHGVVVFSSSDGKQGNHDYMNNNWKCSLVTFYSSVFIL